MQVLRPLVTVGLTVGVTLAIVRAHDPEVAKATWQDIAATGGNAAQTGGYVGGETFRAAGPVINGIKDAAQESGLGEMLTPDEPVPGGIAPPQGQPAPGTQP